MKSRLFMRVQITTDGHPCYMAAIMNRFYGEADYAKLVKVYATTGAQPGSSPRAAEAAIHRD